MPWSMWQAIHDGSLPAALQPGLRWGLRSRDGEEDHIQIRFLPVITVAQYHMKPVLSWINLDFGASR